MTIDLVTANSVLIFWQRFAKKIKFTLQTNQPSFSISSGCSTHTHMLIADLISLCISFDQKLTPALHIFDDTLAVCAQINLSVIASKLCSIDKEAQISIRFPFSHNEFSLILIVLTRTSKRTYGYTTHIVNPFYHVCVCLSLSQYALSLYFQLTKALCVCVCAVNSSIYWRTNAG